MGLGLSLAQPKSTNAPENSLKPLILHIRSKVFHEVAAAPPLKLSLSTDMNELLISWGTLTACCSLQRYRAVRTNFVLAGKADVPPPCEQTRDSLILKQTAKI